MNYKWDYKQESSLNSDGGRTWLPSLTNCWGISMNSLILSDIFGSRSERGDAKWTWLEISAIPRERPSLSFTSSFVGLSNGVYSSRGKQRYTNKVYRVIQMFYSLYE